MFPVFGIINIMELTLSLAQISVSSAPEENLKKAEALIAEAKKRGSELVCFPEMWTTGLNWKGGAGALDASEAAAEEVAGLAGKYKIWINGSMLMRDELGQPANTSILFDDAGKKRGIYRKIHLFGLMHEEKNLAAGDKLCIANTPWGAVGLSICYDIRFPELFRSYALKGAKIILCPAAFPEERIGHWKVLLRARAIEDQVFMVGTNLVGREDFGKEVKVGYGGSSAAIGPWGEVIIEAAGAEEEILTATIDLGGVDEARAKMDVLKDRKPKLYELG